MELNEEYCQHLMFSNFQYILYNWMSLFWHETHNLTYMKFFFYVNVRFSVMSVPDSTHNSYVILALDQRVLTICTTANIEESWLYRQSLSTFLTIKTIVKM